MVEYRTWVEVAFDKCDNIDLETIGQLWTENKSTLSEASVPEARQMLECP